MATLRWGGLKFKESTWKNLHYNMLIFTLPFFTNENHVSMIKIMEDCELQAPFLSWFLLALCGPHSIELPHQMQQLFFTYNTHLQLIKTCK